MFAVAVCLHLTHSHVKSVIEEKCEHLVWKKNPNYFLSKYAQKALNMHANSRCFTIELQTAGEVRYFDSQ